MRGARCARSRRRSVPASCSSSALAGGARRAHRTSRPCGAPSWRASTRCSRRCSPGASSSTASTRSAPAHVSGVDAHVDRSGRQHGPPRLGSRARASTGDARAIAARRRGRRGRHRRGVRRASRRQPRRGRAGRCASRARSRPRSPSRPVLRRRKGVRLTIPHGLSRTRRCTASRPAAPPIDADVDGADAAVNVVPGTMALEVRHARIAARGTPPGTTTRGTLDGRLAQPAPDGDGTSRHATWSGTIGELAGTRRRDVRRGAARRRGGRAREARPECVRDVWAACPFGEATSRARRGARHAAAAPRERASDRREGVGRRRRAGRASATRRGANLHVTATAIDAHALAPSAPPSDLTASGDVTLRRDRGRRGGRASSRSSSRAGRSRGRASRPTTVVGHAVERRRRRGRPRGGQRRGARARRPGHRDAAPLARTGSSFDGRLRRLRRRPAPRRQCRGVGPVARGSARAHGARHDRPRRTGASMRASTPRRESLEAGSARLDEASLAARVLGPLTAPSIDADARRERASPPGLCSSTSCTPRCTGRRRTRRSQVSLHGHGADFFARADVDLRSGATLRDVVVAVDRDGESARARGGASCV